MTCQKYKARQLKVRDKLAAGMSNLAGGQWVNRASGSDRFALECQSIQAHLKGNEARNLSARSRRGSRGGRNNFSAQCFFS